MKIGLVLEKFDPQKGGLEHWTWQFAHRLVELGHEVHVIAFEFAKLLNGIQLTLHQLEPSPSPLRRAAALEDKLSKLDFDVIHDMGCGWYADIFHPHGGSTLALWNHNLMRIPRWRQIRFWREKRYRELAEIEKRQQTRRKAVLVAVSQMVQNHFQTLHGVAPERIRLIYNGVDTNRFSPQHCTVLREPMRQELGCRGDETLFLLVAHNLLLKNAATAIRALGALVSTGAKARLLIVGGKRTAPFLSLARKLGVSGQVAILEPVTDVRRYYAAADVCLHPTWYDPCSLVTLEALACGVPVITTRFNGVAEMITDAEQGFVLNDPGDVGALAETMNRMCDAGLRQQMGTAARQVAAEHPFERQVEEFLELYRTFASPA